MSFSPFQLNDEQAAAVRYLDGPLLIIAGAGTGKTRVITERVAFLLEHVEGLRPENILALTFTERATAEMAGRIRERLADSTEGQVRVHTFHSFALKMLQEQSHRLKRQRETGLLDDIEFWILLRRNLERLRLEVFWKNAEPGKFLKNLIEFMSRANDELVSVEDFESYVDRMEQEMETVRASQGVVPPEMEERLRRDREIARVYRVASELLEEAGQQTYGDLIASAVRLVRRFPEVRQEYEGAIRAILIDEFQDTNVAQIELLELLAASHQNITVVGDDDQGIYRFRGASSESFNLFARTFPRFHQLKLTQNYRSTRRILRVANQLISVNPDRFDPAKNLWTENPEGAAVSVMESPEPDDEAFAVTERIARLREAGRALADVAVLYRAHSHRDLLIKALRRRGIPYQVVGLSVLGYSEVRDLMAAARFLVKPHDNIACGRVLALNRWRLTEEEWVELAHRTSQHPRRDQNGRPSLFDVVQEITGGKEDGSLRKKLVPFLDWTKALQNFQRQRPAIVLGKILAGELGAGPAARQGTLGEITSFNADAVTAPVRRCLEFVEAWQKKNPGASLQEFLEYFDLFLQAGGDITEEEQATRSDDAVRLMTVHAAKGLEFPVVFVLRLTQNYFPSRRRSTLIPFPEALRKEGELPPGDFHTQEERRLCYVALTRAKEQLILSSVVKPRWKPSKFLSDLARDKNQWARDTEPTQVSASGVDLANGLSLDPRADEESVTGSRLPFWALRNTPVKSRAASFPAATKLSASSMETYEICPMQYKFSREYKLSAGPSAALTVGAVLHECVKQFFAWKKTESKFPVERLEQWLDQRWRSVGFEDEYQERRYRADALDQLRRFYAKHIDQGVEVLEQEKDFEFRLGDVTLIGRIDQMNGESGGRVELIDYKTGRPKEQRDAEKSLQLSVYALACREFFHRPPATLSFYNLVNGEKVSTERSATQLELDRAHIQEIAVDIRRRIFPPVKSFFCGYCEYFSICPAWEEIR